MSYELMNDVRGKVSNHYKKLLDEIILKRKIPMHILVSIALDHEFQKEKPFDYDVDPPKEKYVELAFASDAGKILTYLSRSSGMPLESILLMRHDIGIPDKHLCHLAFRECLLSKAIESYIPKKGMNSKFTPDADYVFYRIKGANTIKKKSERKKATEYEIYLKGKQKFEGK